MNCGEPPSRRLNSCSRKLTAVDLVLVEGYKRAPHPKIEVFRAANGKPPLHPGDATILAVATDAALPDADRPLFGLDDAEGIASFALERSVPPTSIDWRRG